MTGTASEVEDAVSQAARQERGRLVALLAGQYGDLDLADEAVQDALEEAFRVWPTRGTPTNPAGWLLTVARRKAIDRLRRAASARRRTLLAAPELVQLASDGVDQEEPEDPMHVILDHAGIGDDQLRLILLCCHPALDEDTQVALVLRLVGGLTTAEIAAAWLLPEATLAQRIVRAKRKIRDARIPLSIPADLDGRVEVVLQVLYLIHNEGYLTRGRSESAVRVDLVDEAVRLTNLVVDLAPDSSEAKGLLALQLYHRSRSATRVDRDGELVLLEDQDRSRWDLTEITLANRVLADAVRSGRLGPFQLQAVIAGHHANARIAAETSWTGIVAAYDQLLTLTGAPVVALNRAVAVAMADGPQLGLALLDEITGLEDYYLFHAARGELHLRAGDPAAAITDLTRARALAPSPAEQRHLDRRRSRVLRDSS